MNSGKRPAEKNTPEQMDIGIVSKFTNPPTKFQQHGLAGFGAGGTGHLEEAPIAWFSIVIGDQHGHGMVALGFGPQMPWVAQVKTIDRLMASVQPNT